jgi:magnesium chelatase subunit D
VNEVPDRWSLAAKAAAAFSVDPDGLKGITLRDRPGPVRDAFLSLLVELVDREVYRLPGTLDVTALSGGLDLGETLRSGRKVYTPDPLTRAQGDLMIVPMAERLDGGMAAKIAAAMDGSAAPALVLLDEGAEPEEAAPVVLSDRLAISLNLEGMAMSEVGPRTANPDDITEARKCLSLVSDAEAPQTLTALAAAMAIPSLRAPVLALRLARALAALDGETAVGEAHIATATALCLAPRARAMPQVEVHQDEDQTPADTPPDDPEDKPETQSNEQGPMEDRVLEAVAAMLPELVLTAGRQRGAASSNGSGERKRSASHGRPIRPRPGKPEGKRLDVFSTLLSAAPWQAIRRRTIPERKGLIVLPDDFRIKQYDRPAESVLIFVVDASGSQAASRMAEAKGAVELMLAEAYRRREKVALIAFRQTCAELILPPTRSLLQAKRRLAVLPGGGPTPLASALVAGRELAGQLRRRGATPYLVILTDGRGNIALDGEPGRARAAEDAAMAARAIAADGITSALIDTANRPQADAQTLARTMAARYLPLPRADAKGISRIVRASVAA